MTEPCIYCREPSDGEPGGPLCATCRDIDERLDELEAVRWERIRTGSRYEKGRA